MAPELLPLMHSIECDLSNDIFYSPMPFRKSESAIH